LKHPNLKFLIFCEYNRHFNIKQVMKIKKSVAISESGFVFDSSSGNSFSMNDTGKVILNMMKEEKSENEIKKYFVQNYEVSKSEFEKNYLDFLSLVQKFNLHEKE